MKNDKNNNKNDDDYDENDNDMPFMNMKIIKTNF